MGLKILRTRSVGIVLILVGLSASCGQASTPPRPVATTQSGQIGRFAAFRFIADGNERIVGVELTVGSDVLFAVGSAVLTTSAERSLAAVLEQAVALPRAVVTIVGHTD